MEADLGVDVGNRYSVALLVFFIPYFIFEVIPNPNTAYLALMVDIFVSFRRILSCVASEAPTGWPQSLSVGEHLCSARYVLDNDMWRSSMRRYFLLKVLH